MAYEKHQVADAVMSEPLGDGQQPLSSEEAALTRRGYALFRHFADELRDDHEAMKKARRIREMRQSERSRTAPVSTTLTSCLDNVIADQIDNMPEALMLPEREETAQSAEEMSDVVSYVLYQAGWPGKYQRIMEDAAVTGTGVAQVFWDDDLEDGAGMVNVLAWHPEDFYPDPTQENIQDGRACFKVTHTTVAWVEEHYPHARGFVRADPGQDDPEISSMNIADGDEGVTLIEFWYRRYDAQTRRYRVHMAIMAGGALLYSTELGFGGAGEYPEGVYAHGQYPFVLYKYRDVCRKPFGTGLVHDYKDTQQAIDRCLKYIDDNARESSVQRHFVRSGGSINADQFADMSQRIIEWKGGNLNEEIQTFQAEPLNGQVYQIMTYLADAMKQDCGQNQFARGDGGLGVTAAGAIQALQEAGSKITRWHTEKFKDSFREMVEQILWVLSDYFDGERTLNIVGGWNSTGNMQKRLVTLLPVQRVNGRLPKPAYTVRVQVQKNNPLQIQKDNEFLLQAVQICADGGAPLPPEVIVQLMEGYRNKNAVLRAIEENQMKAAAATGTAMEPATEPAIEPGFKIGKESEPFWEQS